MAEGAKKGLAVVYTTSEVTECLSIAHRIIVMHKGKISATFGPDATKEQIMAASGEVDPQQSFLRLWPETHYEVVTDLHQEDLALGPLGVAGGKFLSAEIASGRNKVIGAGHGRTLLSCVQNLDAQPAQGLNVVSLMGALTAGSRREPTCHRQQAGGTDRGGTGFDAGPLHRESTSDRDVLMARRPRHRPPNWRGRRT